MKKKPFWIPMIVSISTISILYLTGHLLDIDFLKLFYSEETSTHITFGGSLNPIIIGIIVGFITERIYKNKQQNKKR